MTRSYKGLDCLLDMDKPEYEDLKTISQAGTHSWEFQKNYAFYVLYFGAALISLMIAKKLFQLYSDFSYRNSKLNYHRPSILNSNKPLNYTVALSRYLTYKRIPLIVSRITGLPPSFGTLFVIFGSFLALLCFLFVPGYYLRPCGGFGAPPLSVRAGMMCVAMVPFIFTLSGKTNFISAVTGISYEKLNIFHQFLGWGSLFLALVHVVPFLLQPMNEGGSKALSFKWDNDEMYRNGVPPFIFLILLCFASLRTIRKFIYETWWHCHWILGLAYFATLTHHIYGSLDAEQFMWGTLGFWGFQILYRLVVKTTFKPSQFAFKHKVAILKALSDDVFEVNVTIKGLNELKWMPGQHIFVRFIHGLRTIDNHPFSILTIPEVTKNNKLKLIVKSQKGLTKTLYDEVVNQGKQKYNIYIDGPYGGMNRDCLSFDKLVLVSSGTGVSVTFPFLQYVSLNLQNATSCVETVDFIWVIKDIDSLKWFEDELITVLNRANGTDPMLSSFFNIHIYITNSDDSIPDYVGVSEKVELQLFEKDSINVTGGISKDNYRNLINIHLNAKPNFDKYFQNYQLSSRNAFIVSGTQSLQNQIGNSVSQLQKKVFNGSCDEIYLHTENFGW